MKVEERTYLRYQALVLTPETPEEKDSLKRCLGSKTPLRVIGALEGPEGTVILWDDSQNAAECAPEQSKPVFGPKIVHKKADLGGFMNALRRYINVLIDSRVQGDSSFSDKVHEASQDLQKIVKPLFEEEIHG